MSSYRVPSKDQSAVVAPADPNDKSLSSALPSPKTFQGPPQQKFFKHREMAEGLLRLLEHPPADAAQCEAALARLAEPGARMFFPVDSRGVTLMEFCAVMRQLRASFPDLRSQMYDTSYRESKDGSVVTFDLRCSGTHSGAPFAFPPGAPLVQPANKFVANSPELVTLRMSPAGKLASATIAQPYDGSVGGPLGFYFLVGGVLPRSQVYRDLVDLACKAWSSGQDTGAALGALMAPGAKVTFAGAPPMTCEQIGGLMSFVHRGLSGLKVHLHEATLEELGCLVRFEMHVEADHTGPYCLPVPGFEAPVAATGRHLVTPVERATLLIDADTRKVKAFDIQTLDGAMGGPPSAYIILGGKPNISVGERNIQLAKKMYGAFRRGDIPGVLSGCAKDVDWCWGEETADGSIRRRLPWFGRWVGHEGITQGFAEFTSRSDVLKFQDEQWFTSADGRDIIAVTDIISTLKADPTRTMEITAVHRFTFNDEGMLTKFRDSSDSLLVAKMYQ